MISSSFRMREKHSTSRGNELQTQFTAKRVVKTFLLLYSNLLSEALQSRCHVSFYSGALAREARAAEHHG